MPIVRLLLGSALFAAASFFPSVPPASPNVCTLRPVGGDARTLLDRAVEAMGVTAAGGKTLRFRSMESDVQAMQSDRSYPPFFSSMFASETWLDPETGIERVTAEQVYPGTGPTRGPARIVAAHASYMARDTTIRPMGPGHGFSLRLWRLDPWAVVQDWRRDAAVRVAGECVYRDYPRTVLEREVGGRRERLFVDRKTGFPAKLEFEESHFLWGQVLVEYLYSTWIQATGGGTYPSASFRLEDGETVISRTVGQIGLVPRDSAPRLTIPADAPDMRAAIAGPPPFPAPDTVRVGPQTFLLVNPAYTQTVTLVGDTVYLLDATMGEERARQDSTWIARLFPGRHPVTVVVTDLAWPHIAGVRFWAANGATIVTHRASREFLKRVIDRRWTRRPDLLENRRKGLEPTRFVLVSDSLRLARGAITLYPIDGIGTEGALMAYLPRDNYLWASDYIQRLDEPSAYLTEVWRATRRVGITPGRVAAEHLRLTDWGTIEKLAGRR